MTRINCMIIFTLICLSVAQGQSNKGKVVYQRLYAKSLENNAGENPERRITIYLPPGYNNSFKKYPVLYYLHGFTWSDSLMIAGDHIDRLLDKAINEGIMRPMIVVMPDHHTLYRGSHYINSTYTGKWADFTAIDLVKFVDEHYRTIARRESRGIAGHSMGGAGAIKLGMEYPEVFSAVYGLNPIVDHMTILPPDHPAFKRITELKTREEVTTEFFPNAIIAYGQAISPNPAKPPFYADLPYEYKNGQISINDHVLELWNKAALVNRAASYADSLRKLTSIKFDWGRNEDPNYILTCKIFSKELEKFGINHFAEEYIGDHTNMLWTHNGRAVTDLFPFFNRYLKFE